MLRLCRSVLLSGFLCLLPSVGGSDALDAHTRARAALDANDADTAIELLKAAVTADPERETLRLLLAEAYLKAGNERWALRTLTDLSRAHPESCDAALAIAAIFLEQGKASEAGAVLQETRCPPDTPQSARHALLRARTLNTAGRETEARAMLDKARHSRRMYLEDRDTLADLLREQDETYIVPATGKVETSLGWASDARAGSPRDAAANEESPQSPFMRWEGETRWRFPTGVWVRPGIEGRVAFAGYTAPDAREESTLTLGASPSLRFGPSIPAVTAGYRFESLSLIAGDRYDDGPIWFYAGHRGELEVQLPYGLLLFGGGGARSFREMGRSRMELDGGIGGHASIQERIRLIAALTVRGHDADNDAFDLRGLTALLSGIGTLPKAWSLRLTLLFALDDYPFSAGYFAPLLPETHRRDTLFKLSVGPTTPAFHGLKASLVYEFANRWSSAPDYAYTDHRVLLRLTYSFAADPFLPRRSRAPHFELPRPSGSAELEERVQDLIRREEAAARSSSCIE